MWSCVLATASAALIGFGAGFATFKRSQHWCPECGELITRSHCPRPRPRGVLMVQPGTTRARS